MSESDRAAAGPARRRELAGASASIAGAIVAWAAFRWLLPASHVLVGTTAVDAWVPPHYQASAFAPFCGFAAVLAADLVGASRRAWRSRAALLVLTSLVAAVRLGGLVPLSGHAVLAAAVLAHEARSSARTRAVAGAALASAAITGWYKLFVWGDAPWFVVSCALGACIGLACAAPTARERAG